MDPLSGVGHGSRDGRGDRAAPGRPPLYGEQSAGFKGLRPAKVVSIMGTTPEAQWPAVELTLMIG